MSRASQSIALESQAMLVEHGRSFRFAQLFLGRQQSAEAALAYAFCRVVDDAVDEAPSTEVATKQLADLRGMLENQLPRTPLVQAYCELAQRRGFGLGPARDLLAGAASDLGRVALQSDAELGTYCYRVAGTVGLMMCGILGVTDPYAKSHAVALGVAMQLTNICRDVREDARLCRVYLPATRLAAHGLSQAALLDGSLDSRPERQQALGAVVRNLLVAADLSYAEGEAGLRYLPARARLAVSVASRVYGGIGRRLARRHAANPWPGRVRLPWYEKWCLLAVAFGLWVRASLGLLPKRPEVTSLPFPLEGLSSP